MTRTTRTLAIALLVIALRPSTTPADSLEHLEPFEGRIVSGVGISGNSITREYVILREIRTHRGQPLSVETLAGDYNRLENLGIFSSISILAIDTPTDSVAVEFVVREMPWIIPLVKFRYTEQDGWSIGPAISSVNMLGYAVSLSASALFGGTTQGIVESRGPWFTSNRLRYDLRAAFLERQDDLNMFDEDSIEIAPWINYYITDTFRTGGTVGYFQMKADRDSITLASDRRDDFGVAGFNVLLDTRNSWRNTTSGWWLEFQGLRYWHGGDWWRGDIDMRRWVQIGERNAIAAGVLYSGQTGTVGVDVPGYFMFRMGGANSIRGYDIDVTGLELYGQNQFITTVEYQFLAIPLREWPVLKWAFSLGMQVAAFADFGNAWNNDAEFRVEDGLVGWGGGIRFLVPGVNMVRLDVGVAEDGDVRFHFAVWDKFTAQRFRLR